MTVGITVTVTWTNRENGSQMNVVIPITLGQSAGIDGAWLASPKDERPRRYRMERHT
jgi:S-formylglutathione hydrolase FrmB